METNGIETKDNKMGVAFHGAADLGHVRHGVKSDGNLPTTEIVEKSPESGNLTDDLLVGNLVKAPPPDFRIKNAGDSQ